MSGLPSSFVFFFLAGRAKTQLPAVVPHRCYGQVASLSPATGLAFAGSFFIPLMGGTFEPLVVKRLNSFADTARLHLHIYAQQILELLVGLCPVLINLLLHFDGSWWALSVWLGTSADTSRIGNGCLLPFLPFPFWSVVIVRLGILIIEV